MFKRSKSVNSNKTKQSSLFDFFSHSSVKSSSHSQSDSQSTKAKKLPSATKRLAKSLKVFSKKPKLLERSADTSLTTSTTPMEERDTGMSSKSESCPSRLLEALENCDELNTSGQDETSLNQNDAFSKENLSDKQPGDFPTEISESEESEAESRANLEAAVEEDSPLLYDSEPLFSSEVNGGAKGSSPVSPVALSLGTSVDELRRTPECSDTLPALQPSSHHTVLFDETLPGITPPPPRDPQYRDAWDSYHVRLPCSTKNVYPVKRQGPFGEKDDVQSRWELIQSSLLTPINNSFDLKEAILKYNSRYTNYWSFRALHKFFAKEIDDEYKSSFFSTTLPAIIRLALMLPQICTQPIPLLSRQRNHQITLTQQQIACLLCNAFLCTFPWRNSKKSASEYSQYPDINFSRLLSGSTQKEDVVLEKLKMIFNYFKRVTTHMPNGNVTFQRRSLDKFPNWNESPCTLCRLHITSEGMIENDGTGMLQVDFANRYIGGGVLGGGSVQEEIRFCICPELIVSRLFCEALDDNECIVITGAEQYSTYSGYGSTLKWTGDFVDTTVRDEWRRRITQIVAIDALPWANHQYSTANIKRELNKAYCGFFCDYDPDHAPAIATGKWGCGAFGGDPMLKSLLQLLAAATIGRDLCYFTFGDTQLAQDIYKIYSFIVEKQLQIRDIWRALIRYNSEIIAAGANEELVEFIQRIHNEYNDSTDEES